jgi:hypothetical protein
VARGLIMWKIIKKLWEFITFKNYISKNKMIKTIVSKKETDKLKRDGDYIYYIRNPTEEQQLIAVRQNGIDIKWIKNPSESVQDAAIKRNFDSFFYIRNISDNIIEKYYDKNNVLFQSDEFLTKQPKRVIKKIYNLSLMQGIL